MRIKQLGLENELKLTEKECKMLINRYEAELMDPGSTEKMKSFILSKLVEAQKDLKEIKEDIKKNG